VSECRQPKIRHPELWK